MVKKKELSDMVYPEELSMQEYIDLLHKDARPARTAFQRVYDMIIEAGTEKFRKFKEDLVRYKFFSDIQPDGSYSKDSIFGLEKSLMDLVSHFGAGANRLGAERRVLLMHGPVGSAKSTIARLIKRGLEEYSTRQPLYTFRWVGLGKFGGDGIKVGNVQLFDQDCQLHEDPIKLLPPDKKHEILASINKANQNGLMKYPLILEPEAEPCPHCRFNLRMLMKHYKGDWNKVMEHVQIYRINLKEADRIGIGTFQPKDEKNQDSTELTGNIDYRKLAYLGSDSDPRSFNFDGELCIANRGVVEFIEILKLETAFLYDLLSASQEHLIKPKKFALTHIDEVIIGHTNEEEYKKLKDDEMMRAFRDRTRRFNIPYNTSVTIEKQIYEKDFNERNITKNLGKHIAPHTLEIAAMWAVLTRLEGPKEEVAGAMTIMQKLKLYDGKRLKDFTEDTVKKLKEDAIREGLDGISPRFVQDAIYDAIMHNRDLPCVNPFMVMNEIKENLRTSTLLNREDVVKEYDRFLKLVEEEYEGIIKNEVQRAISSDESELDELCNKYITNVMAYSKKERVKNPHTGRDEEPDERLMRSIEEKIGVTDASKDDFRSEMIKFIAHLRFENKPFDYKSNEQLRTALEKKLFDDKKDSINFKSILSGLVDPKEQEKLDIVTSRLKKQFGYCDVCAKDVLEYVASIFARGDIETD